MSSLGKQTRLNRIFSHPSGRILSVAADHMINYPSGAMPEPLKRIEETIARIIAGRPNALTVNKGVAKRCIGALAGRVPLIIQQMALGPDRDGLTDHASVEEVLALGGDAIAVAIFVRRDDELANLKQLSVTVREADRFGLPVIPHIYPLIKTENGHVVSRDPDDLFYAARAGVEMGADVVKVPYTGDVKSFADIVTATPIPIVASGGPKCETLEEAVAMMREVAQSGAAGSTAGRNVWGFPDIPAAIQQLKAALGIDG
jgi:class I fructose-bisphosphate aldolase